MWAEQVKTEEDAQLLADVSKEIQGVTEAPATLEEQADPYTIDEPPVPAPEDEIAPAAPIRDEEAPQVADAPADAPAPAEPVWEDAIPAPAPAPVEEDKAAEDVPAVDAPTEGFVVVEPAPMETAAEAPQGETSVTEEPAAAAPDQAVGATVPFTEEPQEVVASPTAEVVAFPGSDDTASRAGSTTDTVTKPQGSVSFGPGVETPPRAGTPDPEEDKQKRRRITSQNLGKIAKRLTLGRRVSSNMSIDQRTSPSPRASSEMAPSGSSPTASIDESKKKKERPRRMPTLSFSRPKAPPPPPA